jgi:hypothetical protein
MTRILSIEDCTEADTMELPASDSTALLVNPDGSSRKASSSSIAPSEAVLRETYVAPEMLAPGVAEPQNDDEVPTAV